MRIRRALQLAAACLVLLLPPRAGSFPVSGDQAVLPPGTELNEESLDQPREIFKSEAAGGRKSYLTNLGDLAFNSPAILVGWPAEPVPAAWCANRLLRMLALVASAAAGALACVPAGAQEFSADVTTIDAEGQFSNAGKLMVSSDRVRFETPDVPNAVFLVSSNPIGAYLIRPAYGVFMDAGQSSRVILLFVSVNPDDPCPQWLAMSKLAGVLDQHPQQETQWRCDRVGSGVINGRNSVRFRAATPDGRRRIGWIDPLLRFPLKVAVEDGATFELRNIIEEAQPPDRFEIPPGSIKFDPRELIERLKKSDVWVHQPP